MSRHPNQQLGYGRPFSNNNQPKTARAIALLARSKGKTLEQVTAERPLHPPHRHAFEGGVCKVCQAQEIEST